MTAWGRAGRACRALIVPHSVGHRASESPADGYPMERPGQTRLDGVRRPTTSTAGHDG
jgi:hypothetical protein